jgi:Fur family ferric uptake transcriptional regulator
MSSPGAPAADQRTALEAAGVRYSGARKKVADRLWAEHRPMSAEDMRQAEPSVPYSSVYGILALLARAGVARRLVGTDRVARFELAEAVSGEHRHHLSCVDCGAMDVLLLPAAAEDELARAARAVEQAGRFVVRTSRVELAGLCPACAAQQLSRTVSGLDGGGGGWVGRGVAGRAGPG